MELTKHRISLDIHKQTTQAHLAVKKGDTARQIVASLTSSGVPYHIVEGCYAVFMGKKPDGNVLYNACTIEGDRIVYSFTEQTASAAGTMICELRLYGADGNLITSPRIALIVSGTVYEDTEVESADEYSALSGLVAETLALRKKFPQSLSIDGVRYDGSEAVEVESSYTVSMDRMHDGTWVMMGSDEEIAKANASGKPVYCRCFGRKLPLVGANGTYGTSYWNFVFAAVVDGMLYQVTRGNDGVSATYKELSNKEDIPETMPNPYPLTINGRNYDGSKEVTILDAPLVVHVDGNDNNGYGMDVSLDVIDSAYRTGRRLWCQLGSGVILPLVTTYGGGNEYGYTFSGVDGSAVWRISVGTDGIKVTSSPVAFKTDLPTALPNPKELCINGKVYDGSAAADIVTTALTVTVNPLDEGGYTCDKTMDELKAAHNAGRELYCVWGARLPMVGEYGTTSSDIWGYTFRGIVNGREYSVNIGTDGISVAYTKLVPNTLPNPYPLTINGQNYDGSYPLTLSISGGTGEGDEGGSYIPVPAVAEVGQTIVVKAVDENGKPTEWESVNLDKSWVIIKNIKIEEDVTSVLISSDSDGNPFSYDELMIYTHTTAADNVTTAMRIKINGLGDYQMDSNNSFVKNDGCYTLIEIRCINRRALFTYGGSNGAINGASKQITYNRNCGNGFDNIYSIAFYTKSGAGFKAGSTFSVYGKKH